MFSGGGIYCDGVMCGLVVRGTIYLKADASSVLEFKREGSGPFTYTRGRKSGRSSDHALPYWRLPGRLYHDPDELAGGGESAFATPPPQKISPRQPTRPQRKREILLPCGFSLLMFARVLPP